MRLAISLLSLTLLSLPAEARTAHYGGVAQVICNKRGCFNNPNYAEQMEKQNKRNAKVNTQ